MMDCHVVTNMAIHMKFATLEFAYFPGYPASDQAFFASVVSARFLFLLIKKYNIRQMVSMVRLFGGSSGVDTFTCFPTIAGAAA
jgi:hypothetical protein